MHVCGALLPIALYVSAVVAASRIHCGFFNSILSLAQDPVRFARTFLFSVRTAIYDRGISLPFCYACIQRHEVIESAQATIHDIAEHKFSFYKLIIQKIAWAVNETEWKNCRMEIDPAS